MQGFDFLILSVLVAFGVIGALRGFVREILSLLTWIVSAIAAWFLAGFAAGYYEGLIKEPPLRMVAGFTTVFAIVFAIGLVVTLVVNRYFAARRSLRLPNMIFGGALGVLRAMVLVVIVFLLAGVTAVPKQGWWRDAVLTPVFERIAGFVSAHLPQDVARHIHYG